jgi:hypothetical protein
VVDRGLLKSAEFLHKKLQSVLLERLWQRFARFNVPAHLLVVIVPDGIPVLLDTDAGYRPSTGVEPYLTDGASISLVRP